MQLLNVVCLFVLFLFEVVKEVEVQKFVYYIESVLGVVEDLISDLLDILCLEFGKIDLYLYSFVIMDVLLNFNVEFSVFVVK